MPKINNCRLWPKWQAASLAPYLAGQTDSDAMAKLGRINSLLWTALNIYDDFLDGAGERDQLPIANRYLGEIYRLLYSLNLGTDFYNLFHRSMVAMEETNQRKIKEPKIKIKKSVVVIPARLRPAPNYRALAQRSMPLAWGPLAALIISGQKISSPPIKRLEKFWRYALAAKQLSDDAKDWREDLAQGEDTAASRLILDYARKSHLKINLASYNRSLDILFVQAAAGPLAERIIYYCQQARKQLQGITATDNNPLVTGLIAPLEQAAMEAERFRRLIID